MQNINEIASIHMFNKCILAKERKGCSMFYENNKVPKETGLVNPTPWDDDLVVKRICDQDYSVKRKKKDRIIKTYSSLYTSK